MIKPYLKYKEEVSGETWIENAFSKENVEEIMQGVEGVVNDPEGTGYAAHRDDILLAGKTGTAAVSYTHLDVYKRQAEGNTAEGFGSRICTALFLCQGSVSYTHLKFTGIGRCCCR